ncbi:hypothetical protein [Legionella drozanskii]|uniref:Oxidoreductase n=1 Tax=Legionella drozanskii LLAP-1 TaxID=1212489 RepID=A0A0W0SXJ2_9GAMM|nr:hypothetical protein [Legionella drozanskii]KTC88059.1 oxidoreductase [Legionella drozanskii LLAP-1]
MPIKKIVRVAEKIEITEELLANLKLILGVEEITTERCSDSPNLQNIYKKRIEILYQAFNFVLETTPLKSGSDLQLLKKYLLWCKTQCALPAEADISTYQKILSQYTALLIGGLVDHCDLKYSETVKKIESQIAPLEGEKGLDSDELIASELLNTAEEYVIMSKGGYDIVTLMQMDIHSAKDLVMLWDEQLPPCSKETLAELEVIDKNPIKITPEWFRQLPREQQIYFHSIENLHISISDLKFQLNNFQLKTWPAIKALYEAKKSHSEVFQQSLKSIRDNVKLPTWFTALSLEQQRFLKQLVTAKSEELGTTTTLQQDLAGIVKEQRMPAWYSFINSDQQMFIKALFPADNSTMTDFESRIERLEETFAHIGSESSEKFAKDVANLRKLPYWFLTLENYEQCFLKENIRRAIMKPGGTIADAVAFIPSRLRRLPGFANFRRLNSFILNSQGETLQKHEPSYAFAHLVPRTELKKPKQVLDAHTHRNMDTLLQYGNFFLFQTLISPVRGNQPDYDLEQERQEVLKWVSKTKDATIIPTNHALNMAKLYDYTTSDNPNCLNILKMAESFALLNQLPELEGLWDESQIQELVEAAFSDLKKSPLDESQIKGKLIVFLRANLEKFGPLPNWQQVLVRHLYILNRKESDVESYSAYKQERQDLAHLAREYRSLLNSSYGTATFRDYNGRELFLSTYERLLGPKFGATTCGGCVSCKDRDWVVRCHTISALVYRDRYGEWPSYSDLGEKRKKFVTIAADIFVWGHGFAGADKNAEGCSGTKTADSYWPGDIVTAIKERVKNPRAIEISNILASNNEVAEIGNALNLIKPGFSKFIMQALKLSDENQLELLSRLGLVLEEKKYWQANISYVTSFFKSGPDGIGQMQGHMDTRKDRAERASILANIYSDIAIRPKEKSDRYNPTQRVYDCILELNAAPDPNEILPEILKILDEIKIEAFEYNNSHIKVVNS